MQKTIFWMCLVGLFLQWDTVGAFHDDVYQPRVPIELYGHAGLVNIIMERAYGIPLQKETNKTHPKNGFLH